MKDVVLTNKESQLLQYIIDSKMETGKAPSYGSLMIQMGYKSKRSISVLIENLILKKFLRKSANGSIQVLKLDSDKTHANTQDVPLLGEVSCGIPILAQENIDTVYAVSSDLLDSGSSYFLLRAKGNSMNKDRNGKKGIHSGDLVLVKIQSNADKGEWVVALIDNEATIKEYHPQNDHIVLLPSTTDESEKKPIILSEEFRIQGVVKKVF